MSSPSLREMLGAIMESQVRIEKKFDALVEELFGEPDEGLPPGEDTPDCMMCRQVGRRVANCPVCRGGSS